MVDRRLLELVAQSGYEFRAAFEQRADTAIGQSDRLGAYNGSRFREKIEYRRAQCSRCKLIRISESDLRVTPQLLQAIEMSPLCLPALGIELEFRITRRADSGVAIRSALR